jgi:hypothetical protein
MAIEQAKSLPTHSIVVLNVQNLATQDLPEGVGIMSPEWIREQEEQVGSQIWPNLDRSARKPVCRLKPAWNLAASRPQSSEWRANATPITSSWVREDWVESVVCCSGQWQPM